MKNLMIKILKSNKILFNNLNYFLQDKFKYEAKIERQFYLLKSYEETHKNLKISINILEDFFEKICNDVSLDLSEIAEKLQISQNITKDNLILIKKSFGSKEVSIKEDLLIMIAFVYRFVYNKLPHYTLMNIISDFAEVERKLHDYYKYDKNLMIRFNNLDESFFLNHISGSSELTKYNNKSLNEIMPSTIKNQNILYIIEKISEEEKYSSGFELVIKNTQNEEAYIKIMNVKCNLIPSLNFSEILILGNYEFSPNEFIILEKNYEYAHKNEIYYFSLMSKAVSEFIILTPNVLNYLKKNQIFFFFNEIFEPANNSKNKKIDDESEIDYVINYKNLYSSFLRRLYSFDSLEILNIMNHVKYLASEDVILSVKLKQQLILGHDSNFKILSIKINKKKSQLNDNFKKDKIFTLLDTINSDEENIEIKKLNEHSIIYSSTNLSANSGDSNDFNRKYDRNKNQTQQETNKFKIRIRNSIYVVLGFNLLIIILSIIFLVLTSDVKVELQNKIDLKRLLLSFENDFYYSMMSSLLSFYITPLNNNSNTISDNKNHFDKISKRFPQVEKNNLILYLTEELRILSIKTKEEAILLKNELYNNNLINEDLKLNYQTLTSDGLRPEPLNFFEFLNLIIKNIRVISENNDFSDIFIFNQNSDKIQLFTGKDIFDFSTTSLQRTKYETLVNYLDAFKNFENFEYLVYDKFDEVLLKLNDLFYLFVAIIIILHFILSTANIISLLFFKSSIENDNSIIKKTLTKEKIKNNLDKLRNLKKMLDFVNDPGVIVKNVMKIKKEDVPISKNSSLSGKKMEFNRNYTSQDNSENDYKLSSYFVGFNSSKIIAPYVKYTLIIFLLFLTFVAPCVLSFMQANKDIKHLSELFENENDLSHTIANNLIMTKYLIYSNKTDEELGEVLDDAEDFPWLRNSFEHVNEVMKYHEKMVEYYNFEFFKNTNLTCDYIHNQMNDTLYFNMKLTNPNLSDLPFKMCNDLIYTKNSKNLYENILEELNYSNKQILDKIESSGKVYSNLKDIYESPQFEDLSFYIMFVIRPIQTYIRENVVFASYIDSSNSFYLTIIIFLSANILLEVILFLLIHYKFNKKIMEINEKFYDFLQCIQ